MCGRYSITIDKSTIERTFNAKFFTGSTDFTPTYNAAPSQLLPIITTYAPGEITLAKWRLVTRLLGLPLLGKGPPTPPHRAGMFLPDPHLAAGDLTNLQNL